MSRIPDAFIQDLLTRIDIVEVVGSRVELKRAGREYKGLSPFTNEKSPSFFVNPAKQMFFDFSSGKNGTAITFLMENDRLSFVEAVEELAKRAGVDVPREGGFEVSRLVLDGPLDALAVAEKFYRGQLRTHQPAIDYLKKRGLDGETAKLFNVGYAPESWDALTRLFPEADGQRQHAMDAGLLIERDGGGGGAYDRFRNRVMFPIRDTRGRTIGFGGRTLANDPAKYLNSPETPLFHKGRNLFGLFEAKQSTKSELTSLLVVEGYMDVVMLAQHGIRNAVATLGTATTREHLTLLFKSTRRAVFCFDGDRAGRSAAWRALEQALPEVFDDRECRFMFLPDGHDPDSLVQEIGADAFRVLIEQAQPLSDFLLGELQKQVNIATREGRAQLPGLAKPHLDKMRNEPLRALILDGLTKLTSLRRSDLDAVMATSKSAPAAVRPQRETSTQPAPPTISKAIRRTLDILLMNPALALGVDHLGQLALAHEPGIELLIEMIELLSDDPTMSYAQIVERFRNSPNGEAIRQLSISDIELPTCGTGLTEKSKQTDLDKEFFDSISRLLRRVIVERIQSLGKIGKERDLSEQELQELIVLNQSLADSSVRNPNR